MNTYHKLAPNAWVAKCAEQHAYGDVIEVVNRYGDARKHIVHNLIVKGKDGNYYYSITPEDGMNMQERAKAKAERLGSWAKAADEKGAKQLEASHEGREFLAMAEPIKVGHHSEKGHRALLERNWNRLGKAVEAWNKAEYHRTRIAYWESQAEKIDLSMPESLEYYEAMLKQAQAKHAGLKDGTIERAHDYSLAYAAKSVKELNKKLGIAKMMWGEEGRAKIE